MSLKLNCILNQPSALPQLIALVQKTAHKLNSRKKMAKVEDVYREIRDMGVEIDAESVALAYQNVPGIMGRKNFSSVADVKRFGGESLKSAILVANKGTLTKSRAGKLSISRAVSSGVTSTFSALEGLNYVDKSRLVELQNLLRKSATSMLDKSGYSKSPKSTFKDTLQSLFDAEDLNTTGDEAMNGKVKTSFATMDAIWDNLKDDLSQISAGIKDKAQRARFDQMTAAIQGSSYDLLLGTQQADGVIKDILKEAGYTKEVNIKGTPTLVVDWNKALSNQADWRNDFGLVLRRNGFSIPQTKRILDRLESNYTKALEKQAENRLNQIKKKHNVTGKVHKDAISRIINLKNAGIFAPTNKLFLNEAMGFDIPQGVADQVALIISDYERNISRTGSLSNVETEEVSRAIRLLLGDLNKTGQEKLVGNMEDYFALKASSTISTMFNAFQNVTSGINAAVLPTITSVIQTKNLKLLGFFANQWINTIKDVALGGVSPRDAKTVNLNQFENRGGLSDRWTFDNAKNFFGYVKATINVLGQVTATAADAANGTVIYDAEMVKGVRAVLKSRGLSDKLANSAIDDVIFGKHPSGVSNRKYWINEAMQRLQNQEGVVVRKDKAERIASELMWHDLVTKYGVAVNEVKGMQSAALGQKSKNLGHESDLMLSPSSIINAGSTYFTRKASEAKEAGDRSTYTMFNIANSLFKATNMFVGGKVNWAILALENSPAGIFMGLTDVALKEAFKKGEVPLYRQNLSIGDADKLEEQLRARKAIVSRFERGIYGTLIQSMLYLGFTAMFKGGSDDDDRRNLVRKKFDAYMKDPNTRRLMDKAAPMLLASELQFAFDKKNNRLNEKKISESFLLPYYLYPNRPDAMYEFYKNNVAASTGLDYVSRSYEYNKRISDEGKRANANAEVVSQYVGGLVGIPYTAWWNIVGNEVKVIHNNLQPDPKANAERSLKFKHQKNNIDGWVDAFMNGLVTPDIYQSETNK
jgi:hypothetical protein